jgi:hypothetical protein
MATKNEPARGRTRDQGAAAAEGESQDPKNGDQKQAGAKKFRVKPGQSVTLAEGSDGATRTYAEGEEVSISEEDAARIPWAVETGERRRGGQTSRLKKRIEELEAQLRQKEQEAKAGTKKGDPGRRRRANR